jgi:hypothetical protein
MGWRWFHQWGSPRWALATRLWLVGANSLSCWFCLGTWLRTR